MCHWVSCACEIIYGVFYDLFIEAALKNVFTGRGGLNLWKDLCGGCFTLHSRIFHLYEPTVRCHVKTHGHRQAASSPLYIGLNRNAFVILRMVRNLQYKQNVI